ncbi:hypothetical protein SAMN05428997_12331 [Bosea sp. CRIB-10]|uniref:hypothetical protein n=1 Tax=Bosea sp. CRIB-10 TaxID=378404 RepID=UPI0008E7B2E7|nr:hypothetical protein [Bosea sp. CRIB-10]SFD27911.1 hypothetical protein SAMN05428997_12331 [Bosea sp. CRIB-10]
MGDGVPDPPLPPAGEPPRAVLPLDGVVIPADEAGTLAKQIGYIYDFNDLDVMLQKLYGVRKIAEWASPRISAAEIAFEVLNKIQTDPDLVGPFLAIIYRDKRCVEPLRGMILRIAPKVTITDANVDAQAGAIAQALAAVLQQLPGAPALREALATYSNAYAGFSSAATRLLAYKALHDCLHREQKRLFSDLDAAAATADTDPESRIMLDEFVEMLDDLLQRISDAMSSLSADEQSGQSYWVADIRDAREQIRQGLENRDNGSVGIGLAMVDRVVHERPQQLNHQIIQVMGSLPLSALRDAFGAAAAVGGGPAAQLGVASDKLEALRLRLTERVKEHAIWQRADHTLQSVERQIAAGAGLNPVTLMNLWGGLKRIVRSLIAPEPEEPSTKEIQEKSDLFDDAWAQYALNVGAAEEERARARLWLAQRFYSYRNAVINRFYQVDRRLMADCKAVARLGGPVDALL